MPDEEARGGGRAPRGSERSTEEETEGIRRISRVTIILVVVLLACGAALIGATYLRFLRGFFASDASLLVLRIGTAVVFALFAVDLVLRDRGNVKYAETALQKKMSANRHLRLLLESDQDIGPTLDLSEIMRRSLEMALAATDSEMGAVYLKEKGEDSLKVALVVGVDDKEVMFRELPVGKGHLGEAAAGRRMTSVDDMSKVDERDNVFFGAASPRSQMILPLTAGDRLAGVLVTGNERAHHYTEDEKQLLRGLAELAGMAITNAELYRIARRSLDALARQRGITESVLEEMAAGVITADAGGRITAFNGEAQRITGFPLGEKIEAPLRPETSIDENPLGPLEHDMLQALRSPGSTREGEALVMRRDSTMVSIDYRVYPMVDDRGALGVAAVFMETGRMEKESSRVEGVDYQVLMRSLSARIERLYTHPLSRVIDRVRSMDMGDWAKCKDDFAKILDAGSAALLELLKDIERYLNCTSVREWDSAGEHDVSAILGEAIEEVLKSPKHPGVSVLIKLGDLPLAFGHDRMIRMALREVLENAVEAAGEGDGKVEVAGRARGDVLRIEVRDGGPGVPKENREFIFMPFYTTREGRSGLGLSIAGRVMQRLGGAVTLEEREVGALFSLEFPTTPRLETQDGEAQAS